MPSPFPGMDPYLETAEVWRDFHHAYITALRAELVRRLPDRYVARVEENVYIHEPAADERRFAGRSDAAIKLAGERVSVPGAAAVAGALAAPASAELEPDVMWERVPYIEVRDRHRQLIVTVIELLSPSNKTKPEDRAEYLAKRRRLRAGTAHFVEVDLLRVGPRMPLVGLPPCDYYAFVSRAQDRPTVALWPFHLRDPLPTLPIPLLSGDEDVPLDLKAALDRTYDDAGYARYVYDSPPDPPLSIADAAWAAERAVGGRDS